MAEQFRKDLQHLNWDEVYARQVQRAGLVDEWLDALQLGPGQQIVDVGSGPGFVSLAAARRVGPGGLVYAIDRAAAALEYLERLQGEPLLIGAPIDEAVRPGVAPRSSAGRARPTLTFTWRR